MKNFVAIIFALFISACGVQTEPQAEATFAVTNPQDGINQPWLCSPSSYDPFVVRWPVHGWCAWQPRPGLTTTAVSTCIGIPFAGQMDIWSGGTYTSQCARITIPSQWDFVHMAINGWNAVKDRKEGQVWTTIKSFEIGSNDAGPLGGTLVTISKTPVPQQAQVGGASFGCAPGHRSSVAEHRWWCGVSHLGMFANGGWQEQPWTDDAQIASLTLLRTD